jgi:hypothetical protein
MMHHWKVGTLLSLAAALLFGAGVAAAGSSAGDSGSRGTGMTGSATGASGGAAQPGMAGSTGNGGAAGMQQQGTAGGQQAAMNVTAAQIAQHPGQYFGKRVSLTTQVDRSIDPHFFTVQSNGAGQGPQASAQKNQAQQPQANQVLVAIAAPLKAAPESGTVTISGTVRPFVTADVERDYSWFKSGWVKTANLDIESTTHPLIVADSVTTADGTQLVQSGDTSRVRAGDAPAANRGAPVTGGRAPAMGGNAPANSTTGTSGSGPSSGATGSGSTR